MDHWVSASGLGRLLSSNLCPARFLGLRYPPPCGRRERSFYSSPSLGAWVPGTQRPKRGDSPVESFEFRLGAPPLIPQFIEYALNIQHLCLRLRVRQGIHYSLAASPQSLPVASRMKPCSFSIELRKQNY